MSDKHFTVNYGKGVTVFPEKAIDKIINGEVTLTEIKTLSLILSSGGEITPEEIAAATSLFPQDVENAIAFWRGAGIISIKEGKPRPVSEAKAEGYASSAPESTEVNKNEADVSPKSEASGDGAAPKKALLSTEMPKYSGKRRR